MKVNDLNVIASTITKTIKGVPYNGITPKVGGGWGNYCGSDFYGGKIVEVANDLTWFKTDSRYYGKFDHRKNSIHFGKFVLAYEEGEKLKFEKTDHSARCENMNLIHVFEEPQKTELDPSF